MAAFPSQVYGPSFDLNSATWAERWNWWGQPEWLPGSYRMTVTFEFPGSMSAMPLEQRQVWTAALAKVKGKPWTGAIQASTQFTVSEDSIYGDRPGADEAPKLVSGTPETSEMHVVFYKKREVVRERIYRKGELAFEFRHNPPAAAPSVWREQRLEQGYMSGNLILWHPQDRNVSGSARTWQEPATNSFGKHKAIEAAVANGVLDGEMCVEHEPQRFCGRYEKGRRNGKWEAKENGILIYECTYVDGRLHGKEIRYTKSAPGHVVRSADYSNGRLDGDVLEWHSAASMLLRHYHYTNGEMDGVQKSWHENGKAASEYHFTRGLAEGKQTCWYSNGQLVLEQTFKDGQPEGPFEGYAQNGAVVVRGEHHLGRRIGTWFWSDADGKELAKGTFVNGSPIQGTFLNLPETGIYASHITGAPSITRFDKGRQVKSALYSSMQFASWFGCPMPQRY